MVYTYVCYIKIYVVDHVSSLFFKLEIAVCYENTVFFVFKVFGSLYLMLWLSYTLGCGETSCKHVDYVIMKNDEREKLQCVGWTLSISIRSDWLAVFVTCRLLWAYIYLLPLTRTRGRSDILSQLNLDDLHYQTQCLMWCKFFSSAADVSM